MLPSYFFYRCIHYRSVKLTDPLFCGCFGSLFFSHKTKHYFRHGSYGKLSLSLFFQDRACRVVPGWWFPYDVSNPYPFLLSMWMSAGFSLSLSLKVNSLFVIVITNLTKMRYDICFFPNQGVIMCYNAFFALYNAFWKDDIIPVSRNIMPTEKAFLCHFWQKILNVGVKKIRNNNMVCF